MRLQEKEEIRSELIDDTGAVNEIRRVKEVN